MSRNILSNSLTPMSARRHVEQVTLGSSPKWNFQAGATGLTSTRSVCQECGSTAGRWLECLWAHFSDTAKIRRSALLRSMALRAMPAHLSPSSTPDSELQVALACPARWNLQGPDRKLSASAPLSSYRRPPYSPSHFLLLDIISSTPHSFTQSIPSGDSYPFDSPCSSLSRFHIQGGLSTHRPKSLYSRSSLPDISHFDTRPSSPTSCLSTKSPPRCQNLPLVQLMVPPSAPAASPSTLSKMKRPKPARSRVEDCTLGTSLMRPLRES